MKHLLSVSKMNDVKKAADWQKFIKDC